MIPKIIHQIWLGEKSEMPVDLMKSVEDKHKDWEYKLWTEENTGDLINQIKYNQVFNGNSLSEIKFPKLADIIRYEKLFIYGGIYIDADSRCKKSFDELIFDDFFVGYENETKRSGIIANGVIGSIPNHAILRKCIDEIGQLSEKTITRKSAFKVTGTLLLTKVIQQSENFGIKIYPSRYFYPIHYTDFTNYSLDKSLTNCYTHQMWNSTVRNRKPFFIRVLNRIYRIFNTKS